MQAMQIANGDIQYRFRGTPVCRTMWMRIYGVGRRTMARAKKLLRTRKILTRSWATDLNEEHSRGFKNEAQALDWRARSYLHHKVHRRCREGSLRRAHEAAVCKDRRSVFRARVRNYKPADTQGPFSAKSAIMSPETMGDGQKHWHGEEDNPEGNPLVPYIGPPDAAKPAKLPKTRFIGTDRNWRGLPGRPGHFKIKDTKGHIWTAHVRVLDDLPEDLWALPPDRQAAVDASLYLTEEERKSLPRTFFRNDRPPPKHPSWTGVRRQTDAERKAYDFENPAAPRPPHELVDEMLPQGVAALTKNTTVPALKEWLARHGQDFKFRKAQLVANVLAHHPICACALDGDVQAAGGAGGRRARRGRGGGRGQGRARGSGGGARRGRAHVRPLHNEDSSSDSDQPLIPVSKRGRRGAGRQPRPRRPIRRMVKDEDQMFEAADAKSDDDISSISSNEQLLLSARPKSSDRRRIQHVGRDSGTESGTDTDDAINVRLPNALMSDDDQEWQPDD
eukprot:g58835.t1